jgi:transitional endoplasmic reticulum ATPase
MADGGFDVGASARALISTEVNAMTEVTHQAASTDGSPPTPEALPLQLPVLALVCWIALVLAFLHLTSSRTRRHRTRQAAESPPLWDPTDGWSHGDGWNTREQGPRGGEPRPRGQWRAADRLHEVPVQVIDQPTSAGSAGVHDRTTAMLEDLAGPVLDAGARPFRRQWGGILLHGSDQRDVGARAAELASDHGVPLLVVRARDIVPVDHRRVVEPVFVLAATRAPCVLLIEDVDELADPTAPLVVSRHSRRVEHELTTAVRTDDPSSGIVVIASARSVEDVAPTLLQEGCFDRVIGVGVPTTRQRSALLQRELLRANAALDGRLDTVVRLTGGMTHHRIAEVLHDAFRIARRRAPSAEPLSITTIDVRIALHRTTDVGPLAIGATREAWIRELTRSARDADASFGLILAGDRDNGCNDIARIVASTTEREIAWLNALDLASLPVEDLERMIREACNEPPVVVVWTQLDALLHEDGAQGRRSKSVHAALEHLARTPGTAVIATMQDPALLDPGLIDDGTLEVMWIPAPDFHGRIALLTHALHHVDLADTTVEELAASMHGATRSQVIQWCEAAVHSAVLRAAPDGSARLEVLTADFALPGLDRPS